MKKCPTCGSYDTEKAIYLGFPIWICMEEACSATWGFWSFMLYVCPVMAEDEEGDPAWVFFIYDGSYLMGMWHWLKSGVP